MSNYTDEEILAAIEAVKPHEPHYYGWVWSGWKFKDDTRKRLYNTLTVVMNGKIVCQQTTQARLGAVKQRLENILQHGYQKITRMVIDHVMRHIEDLHRTGSEDANEIVFGKPKEVNIQEIHENNPKLFYALVESYAYAHKVSLADAIRLYCRENNITQETKPADHERVMAIARRIMEEDKELLKKLAEYD